MRPTLALLVCVPDSWFDDDVRAICERCDAVVYHRPHAPQGIERICVRCYVTLALPHDRVWVTPETLLELATWMGQKENLH